MDSKFQTSFIPKRPIVTSSEAPIKVKHPLNLISLICTFIFIVSVLAAGGVFAYEKYLTDKIATMNTELVAAKNSIQSDLINQFIRLDTRITTAQGLLKGHIAASLLFDALQNQTVRNVQFTDLSYASGQGGSYTVSMRGIASSYNAITYQSGLFENDKYILSPTFSDMDLDAKGNVSFSLKAGIDPHFLAASNKLGNLAPVNN